MSKTYLVSEELLRQVVNAWESETGLKSMCEAMDALRTLLAKEPSEPVAQIDEFGVFKDLTENYLPDGTRLFTKDTP